MKKLMILGASYSQMPLIQAAKKLGIYTIVCSTPGSWPGFAEADECSYTDISDPQAVLAEARRTQIQGITTCCLDTGVPAIGTVCEAMGLIGPKAIPAQTASDKWKMKEAFVKAGVQTARHIRVRSEEELEDALSQLTFPVILKAVDLMGSRGIFRSNTKEEARANYRLTMEATGKDYCLVEEFIEGTLFGAEAMLKDGKFLYCDYKQVELSQIAGGQPYYTINGKYYITEYVKTKFDGSGREAISEAEYNAADSESAKIYAPIKNTDGLISISALSSLAGSSIYVKTNSYNPLAERICVAYYNSDKSLAGIYVPDMTIRRGYIESTVGAVPSGAVSAKIIYWNSSANPLAEYVNVK